MNNSTEVDTEGQTTSLTHMNSLDSLIAVASLMARARFGIGLHTYYLPVMIVVGLVGNTLSLLVMLQPHNRRISCCVYMAALAVSDNLFICELAYWRITDLRPDAQGRLNYADCLFLCYWKPLFSSIGVCLVICMTLDRFLAVRFPLQSPIWCSTRRAKITIVVVVVTMALYNLPYLFYSSLVSNGKVCQALSIVTPFSRVYSLFSTILNSVVAFLVLLTLNSVIIFTICTRQLAFQDKQSPNTPNTGSARGDSGSRDISAVLMLLPVSFALLVLTLPFYIRIFVYLIVDSTSSINAYGTFLFVYHFTGKLWLTNNAINFFMYCIGGRKFRQDLLQLFQRKTANAGSHSQISRTSSLHSGSQKY